MDEEKNIIDDFDDDFTPIEPLKEKKKDTQENKKETIIKTEPILSENILEEKTDEPSENIFDIKPDKTKEDIKIENIEVPTFEELEKKQDDKTENIFEIKSEEPLQEEIQIKDNKENTLSNVDQSSVPLNDLANQTLFTDESIKEEVKEDKKPQLKEHLDNIFGFVKNHSRALPVVAFIFVSALGIYIFINNVHADMIDLIKIEEKLKVGYINNNGTVIIKPKYLYGSDFYKGYAIVKNYNNLYGIINGKGNNEIAFGNIFSANLYGNRYIVTKFTNEGLKMGLLDSDLKEITRAKYDNLSYSKAGIFMYTLDDTMGILNSDGKEIYSYKVDEVDDKNISIEISQVNDKSYEAYAKLKVNNSSTIINVNTGKEVYKYTLDDIRVLDNNVFYIKNDSGNNKYFIIKDDKVVYESSNYKRIRVEDVSSNIAIAIKDDASIDYINLLTREKINSDGDVKYTYSDGVVLEEMYNFQTNKNEYKVISPSKVLGTFSDIITVDDKYVNGYMQINTSNNKYSYINKSGNIITNKEYETVSDFNENSYAVVSNDNSYGVINGSGKEIIPCKYDEIILLDDTLFNNVKKYTNEELFIVKINNKYGIINSKQKELVKPIYEDFNIITTKYPIIQATYNNEKILLNLKTYKDLSITYTEDIQIYSDYILSGDDYYNYDGELIYTIGG